MDPIHVLGVGVRSPFGSGAAALFDGLCAARPAFRPWAPFAAAAVRQPFAAPVPDAALDVPGVEPWWDRGTRLLWACVTDALADAGGLPALAADPTRIGLVVGTSSAGVGRLSEALLCRTAPARGDAHYAASTENVARAIGLRGPVLTVGAVCASGAMAIAEAASWLEDGVVDGVIAAGFDPLEPFVAAGFDALGALAEEPHPFRLGRRGLVLGEAAAALVLARRPDARRSRGVLLGWATSTDAHHLTAPHPEGEGVVVAIERALTCAGIDRSRIGAINAHGTGTQLNDAMESAAFRRVFGPRAGGLPVHTVKGTIGHTLAAAGAVEAVVSLESLQRRVVPPTCAPGDPDPAVELDLVCETRPSEAGVALSVSAGFGGINAALLIAREAPELEAVAPIRRKVVIRTSSVRVSGEWIESLAGLDRIAAHDPSRAEPPLGCFGANRRIQRADRTTRLAAAVVARAIEGLPESDDPRRVSIVSASALASAWSNEQWELGRQEKRRPDPRVFAYTTTNAAAGEIAAALGARGPSLAVIGAGAASLAALQRAMRHVESGLADRAVFVAFECPPEHAGYVRADADRAIECAVALVLEPASEPGPSLAFEWLRASPDSRGSSPLLSVEPIARLALAAREHAPIRVVGIPEAGASIAATLR